MNLSLSPFRNDNAYGDTLTGMGIVYVFSFLAVIVWGFVSNMPTPAYQVGEFAKTVVSGEVGQVIRTHCQPFEDTCRYTLRVGIDTVKFQMFEIMTTTEEPTQFYQYYQYRN